MLRACKVRGGMEACAAGSQAIVSGAYTSRSAAFEIYNVPWL